MSHGGVAVAWSVLAAILLSLAPVFIWDWCLPRIGDHLWGPSADTAVLELLLLCTAGAVIIGVPEPPAVRWAVPDMIDVGLILATSPLLWVVGILVGLLSHTVGVDISSADIDSEGRLGPAVVVALVLVGPAEELLFRGLVQPLLVERFGLPFGVTTMGVLFGLYHYPNSVEAFGEFDAAAAGEMAISGIGGIVLGGLYVLSGNLLVPMIGHSLHDAGLFIYLEYRDDQSDSATGEPTED